MGGGSLSETKNSPSSDIRERGVSQFGGIQWFDQ